MRTTDESASVGAMIDELLKGAGFICLALAPIAIPFTLFGLLERRFPAHRLKSAGGWALNIKLALLYLAVPTLFGGVLAGIVAAVRRINGGGLIDLDVRRGASFPAVAAASLLFLLAFDFFYYWWHRAQHEIPALWAMHKLHHMDETLGVSTQLRCHWLEEIGRIPFIFVPMALLFNLPLKAGLSVFLLTAWTGFVHANLRLGLGHAGRIVAGPQFHRLHHSILPQHFDKNYAAMFPLYDLVFGTYRHPARDEYPPTGIAGEGEITSVAQTFMLPFHSWSRRWISARDAAGPTR